MYLATLLTMVLLPALDGGNITTVWSDYNASAITNTFLTMDAGIVLMITGLIHYDKQLPGGKYFRTVNGGFDTYRKMKNASLIARVITLISIMGAGAIIDRLGLFKLAFGTSDVI